MIKKIDNPIELDSYKIIDLYSIRIKSLLNAYGTRYDFAGFYKQLDEDNTITAIISKLDNDITISHTDNFNADEFYEFVKTIGYSSVLSDDKLKLSYDYEQGVVMATDKKAEYHIPYAEIDAYPKLMDLFNFEDYDCIDFEAWYVDVSHRIRHNCAKAVTLNVNGEIVSSGMISSIYDDDAILTSVRTSPEFRRMGYGSALVSEMICDIKGKVYLMRENGKNEDFYNKLGFKNIGKWRMFK